MAVGTVFMHIAAIEDEIPGSQKKPEEESIREFNALAPEDVMIKAEKQCTVTQDDLMAVGNVSLDEWETLLLRETIGRIKTKDFYAVLHEPC